MHNFTFETQGAITYMVYAIQPNDIVDTMSLGMITNNSIPGLAGTIYTQMDENRFIKYNVSSRIPVSQFFMGTVNRKRLIGVFRGIVDAMSAAEEYMIDPQSLVVDLDYIFADVSSCEAVMVCLPVQGQESQSDLGTFFKNIMFNTQFDQSENCDYVAKIINYLNSTPVFSLEEFGSLLNSLAAGGASAIQRQTVAVNAQQGMQVQANRTQPSVAPQQTPALQQQMAWQAQQPQSQGQQSGTQVQQTWQAQQAQPQNQQNRQQAGQVIAPQAPVNVQPQSFAVPPGQTTTAQPQQNAAVAPENEIKLSYLLQHYNKENAAAYKAQKAAKKAGKATVNQANQAAPKPEKAAKQPKKSKQKQTSPAGSSGFAIPGQPQTNMQQGGFAIPGSAPMNTASAAGQQSAGQVGRANPPQYAVPPQNGAAGGSMPNSARQPVRQNVSQSAAPQSSVQQTPPQNYYQHAVNVQQVQGNFGDTTVLGRAIPEGTTVLNAGMLNPQAITPHLIRTKNNERVPVDKPVFRIGKERSYVDYFIGDNTAVSRSHANIIARDGHYYVMDTNSTNHTYVDGQMIQSNLEVEIVHGSKLRLANEDFEFRLY